MSRKKINPRRKPATQADVEKAKADAVEQSVTYAWAIMFTALRDKFGWGGVRLRRLWDRVNSLSESVSEGYIKVDDLVRTLRDEAGIVLKGDGETSGE